MTPRQPYDEHAYDELAVGWAMHALEPDDEAAFTRHLSGCERCRRTVAETNEVMAAMARDLPAAEPSPGLRARLRAAVEETEQLPPGAGTAEPHAGATRSTAAEAGLPPVPGGAPARSRVLPRVLVAAATAAVVGLGVWVAVLDQTRGDLQATVAAQEEVVAELTRPGPARITPLTAEDQEVASVVVREDALQVITDGLEPNDSRSTTYVVWGLGEGDPVALGEFDVARSQIEIHSVGSGETGVDAFPEYGISIEPGRQAPSAPTEVVATGQVTS
ncbi:anti-sigma factor domain-containing protein [Blastococcus xanthinilyticus]|uniref:Regulator of SigK n=1 Tax=Blastococcus xanthinilyticus TaxID=1564164 RepID=A0A5S5CTM6_9ACTN|nr:anti-sigma factor [Blastococcus xanthinilyticus]TYP84940.1 anti-sigma-K factor rskA [Blastococcus xanthinilyticus]